MHVALRVTRGDDKTAACGQLHIQRKSLSEARAVAAAAVEAGETPRLVLRRKVDR